MRRITNYDVSENSKINTISRRRFMGTLRTIGLILLICAFSAKAEVLLVPDDYETIQLAIDEAENGDEINVSAGRYEEIIDFQGKAIRVIGNPENPEDVIIDGGNEDCVVKFIRDERDTSILDGFTLTNGSAQGNGGGGIFFQGSTPIVRNSIVINNRGNRGGGILCWNASPQLTNVIVAENTATAYGGGISVMENSSPIMRDMTIINNIAESNNGGGIDNRSRGRPEIYTSKVRSNTTPWNGGGIYSQSAITMVAVVIDSNYAERSGGGLYATVDLALSNCQFFLNHADEDGGGMFLSGPRPTMERITLSSNNSGRFGGAIYLNGESYERCDPMMLKMTITNNNAETDGGAIYGINYSNPYLINCIIWDNNPNEIYFSPDGASNSLNILYSDLLEGQDGVILNDNCDLIWGAGNIDADPMFRNPQDFDYNLTWENYPEDDESRSPCIDTGHPDIQDDPDGTRSDIGAYYFAQLRPRITISPEEYHFGSVAVFRSAMTDFTVTNTGLLPLHIESVELFPESEEFFILFGDEEQELESNDQFAIRVSFEPQEVGFYQTLLRIRSNDPFQPDLNVSIVGIGGNLPPQIVSPIPDFELLEDSDWYEVAALDTVFHDPEEENLVFQVPIWSEYLEMEIRPGRILAIKPIENFNIAEMQGVVRAVDRSANIVADSFLVTIHPLNDLPAPFSLIWPRDNSELDSWTSDFSWQEALQNQWELDTVRYTVQFISDNEDLYEITDLSENRLIEISIEEIAEALNIQLGIEPITLSWRVIAFDDSGWTESNTQFTFTIPTTSILSDNNEIPENFVLIPNYPNPFNNSTTIEFGLPTETQVDISVWDIKGRRIAVLAQNHFSAGYQRIVWDANGLPAGAYFIRFNAGDYLSVRKAILIK